MKKILPFLLLAVALLCLPACKTPVLEVGGAYNPTTNSVPQLDLELTDASYHLTYDTVFAILKYERDNRAALFKISPAIKHTLDGIRPTVADVDLRWANARKAYKANPSPANLTTIQGLITEIQKLLPAVQAGIAPAYASLTKTP